MTAPLTLKLRFDYQEHRTPEAPVLANLSEGLQKIHCVEELTLISPNTPLLDDVVQSLTKPASLLASFHLEGHYEKPYLQIHENIFGGEVPELRRLHLANCTVMNWSSPLFSQQLTHLTLSIIPRRDSKFNMDPVFQMLGRLSALQRLSYSDKMAEWPLSEREVHDSASIELPNLQELFLLLRHDVLNMFLTRLKYPPSTVVRLELFSFDRSQSYHLDSFIYNWCKGMPEDHPPLQSLVLFTGHRAIERLYLSRSAEIPVFPQLILESIIKQAGLSIEIPSSRRAGRFCDSASSSLCPRNLVVYFRDCAGDTKRLIEIDGSYLSTIHFVNDGLSILLRQLGLLEYFGSITGYTGAVTQIILERVLFPAQCICLDSQCRRKSTTSVSCLCNVLAKRKKKLRHKLQKLVLLNCYGITQADMKKFGGVVEVVDFQGADESWEESLKRRPWLATGRSCGRCAEARPIHKLSL